MDSVIMDHASAEYQTGLNDKFKTGIQKLKALLILISVAGATLVRVCVAR